jgi:hypothetical protein
MMNLSSNFIGQCYSSKSFTWNKETQTFSAEISDVPAVLRQMFNDSMDLGFAMQSAKTGNVVYFTLATAERDREGDMACWTFQAVSVRPGLSAIKVVVYND